MIYSTDGRLVFPPDAEPDEGVAATIDRLREPSEWAHGFYDASAERLFHRFQAKQLKEGRAARVNNYYLEQSFEHEGLTPRSLAEFAVLLDDLWADNWEQPQPTQTGDEYVHPGTLAELKPIAQRHETFEPLGVIDAVLQDGGQLQFGASLFKAYELLGRIAAGDAAADVLLTTDASDDLHDLAAVVVELGEYDGVERLTDRTDQLIEDKTRGLERDRLEDNASDVESDLKRLRHAYENGPLSITELLAIYGNIDDFTRGETDKLQLITAGSQQAQTAQEALATTVEESRETFGDDHRADFVDTVTSQLETQTSEAVATYLDELGEDPDDRKAATDRLREIKTEYLLSGSTGDADPAELDVDPAYADEGARIDDRIESYRADLLDDLVDDWDAGFREKIGAIATEYDLTEGQAKRQLIDRSEEITLAGVFDTFARTHTVRTVVLVLVVLLVLVGAVVAGAAISDTLAPLVPGL